MDGSPLQWTTSQDLMYLLLGPQDSFAAAVNYPG